MDNFLSNAFSAFFVILFIVLLIAFIVLTFQRVREWWNYINTPEETHDAKIVSRGVDTVYRTGIGPGYDGAAVLAGSGYEVVFELENKEQISFYVPEEEYRQWYEGDTGKLTFKKNRYVSFEKNMNKEENS